MPEEYSGITPPLEPFLECVSLIDFNSETVDR